MNQVFILHDDSVNFAERLLNHNMNQNKNIKISGLTGTKKEIIEKIKNVCTDDIIIFDMKYSKIRLTELIKLYKELNNFPHIIIMCGNIESMKKLKKYESYIDEIIPRPYSIKRILWTLDEISNKKQRSKLEECIIQELKKIEINKITMGYRYVIDAVSLAVEDKSLLKIMKDDLYPKIAQKYDGVSVSNVKWTLEKCINSVKRYTPTKQIKEYFFKETKRDVLSTKLFISVIASNIIKKQENEEDLVAE